MTGKIEYCNCERCGAKLQVGPAPGSEAKMLRRSKETKGLCINCAVHDFLRHTYPPNIQLAESGPEILLIPHIQELFAGIMKAGFADANPDEVDWQLIVDNWDLPFPKKVKPSASNPCSQELLDAVAAGTEPGLGAITETDPRQTVCGCKNAGPITSFEELNQIMPGLGDEFKKLMRSLDKTRGSMKDFGDAAGPIAGEIADAEE
jgi:hypothetical protein